jgi:hypothetical protein
MPCGPLTYRKINTLNEVHLGCNSHDKAGTHKAAYVAKYLRCSCPMSIAHTVPLGICAGDIFSLETLLSEGTRCPS